MDDATAVGVHPLTTRQASLDQLGALTANLAAKRQELALVLAAEHEAKIQSWFAADEDTLKGRDRIADFNALHLTLDIIKLKGEILALEDERVYQLEVVHYSSP